VLVWWGMQVCALLGAHSAAMHICLVHTFLCLLAVPFVRVLQYFVKSLVSDDLNHGL
jgi:hypothetical protein